MILLMFPLAILCFSSPEPIEPSTIAMFFPTEKRVGIINLRLSEDLGAEFTISIAENYYQFNNTLSHNRPLVILAPGNTVDSLALEGYEPLLVGSNKGRHVIPMGLLYDKQLTFEQARAKKVTTWKCMGRKQMRMWLKNDHSFLTAHTVFRISDLLNSILVEEAGGIIIPENKIDVICSKSQRSFIWREIPGFYLETPVIMIRSDAPDSLKKLVISRFSNLSNKSRHYLGVDDWD